MQSLARTPQQVGAIIRHTRKRLGRSQGALGEIAGLRQETISLIETGNPAARLDTILSLLGALDLEIRIVPRSGNRDIEDLVR
jgi:HTH-type transcriptional regulator / antitoxin HipB